MVSTRLWVQISLGPIFYVDRKTLAQNEYHIYQQRQKSPKLRNGEVGIIGEAGKNTAIRNFIEMKSSNNLVKKSTERT